MNATQFMQNLASQARSVKGTNNLIAGNITLPNVNPTENSPINLSDLVAPIPDIVDPVTGETLAVFKFLTGMPVSVINMNSKAFIQLGVKDKKKFEDEVMAMSSCLWKGGWDLSLGYSMYDMDAGLSMVVLRVFPARTFLCPISLVRFLIGYLTSLSL